MVRGNDAKIDRNTFHDKSTVGCYLVIDGPGSEAMAQRAHILRNYFCDHSFGGSNGGEPIRLGVSSRALSTADATVEYNLFERVDGDPEAISVKSSGNTVRYNTGRDSLGGIVLRHGNENRVESNYLLSGDNGIRIYGNDHLIVNNYVDGVGSAGILLGSGTERDHYEGEPSDSRRGNDAPDRVTIVLNTLRNNGQAVAGESQRTVPPLGCVIADNLMVGSSGSLVDMPYLDGRPTRTAAEPHLVGQPAKCGVRHRYQGCTTPNLGRPPVKCRPPRQGRTVPAGGRCREVPGRPRRRSAGRCRPR